MSGEVHVHYTACLAEHIVLTPSNRPSMDFCGRTVADPSAPNLAGWTAGAKLVLRFDMVTTSATARTEHFQPTHDR